MICMIDDMNGQLATFNIHGEKGSYLSYNVYNFAYGTYNNIYHNLTTIMPFRY